MVGLTLCVLLTYYELVNKTIIPSFVDFAHVVPEMAVLTLGVQVLAQQGLYIKAEVSSGEFNLETFSTGFILSKRKTTRRETFQQ